jgi:hypothetical protein
MRTQKITVRGFGLAAASAAVWAAPALGEPVEGVYSDLPQCDNHGNLIATEEFGDASVFAPDETIIHGATTTEMTACPVTDDLSTPNFLVEIINQTGRTLTDLFYVGDTTTTFSNVDGQANAGVFDQLTAPAFKIDSIGANQPLFFESLTPDNIFQPGESWMFIVQDYSNSNGLAPDSFFSIGFADASLAVVETSAASIVHFQIPSPAALAPLGLGGILSLRRRRAHA